MSAQVKTALIASICCMVAWLGLSLFAFTVDTTVAWVGAPVLLVVVFGVTYFIGSTVAKSKR